MTLGQAAAVVIAVGVLSEQLLYRRWVRAAAREIRKYSASTDRLSKTSPGFTGKTVLSGFGNASIGAGIGYVLTQSIPLTIPFALAGAIWGVLRFRRDVAARTDAEARLAEQGADFSSRALSVGPTSGEFGPFSNSLLGALLGAWVGFLGGLVWFGEFSVAIPAAILASAIGALYFRRLALARHPRG